MAPNLDPFKILGIDQNATDEEVKRAYRAMASKYHPDAGGDAWVFQQVHAAYESVLLLRSKSTSSTKTGASQQRSEPSTKSSTEGFSAKSGASKAESGKEKSKEGGWQEQDIPSSPSSQMPSRGSSRQFSGQNESETRKSVTNASHGLWRVFFGPLPLQNETSVFILVSVLDIFTTYALLRFGGHEANPIANFFLRRWNVQGMVFFKMALVAFVAVLSQIIARRNLARASQVLNLGTIVVTAVVLYSVYLLARKL